MYDVRQYRPTLYLLLLIGLSGFAMASDSPGLWLFSMAGVSLNAWLVKTGRFVPLPRWLANVVTLGALAYVIAQLAAQTDLPLMIIGQFLVLLQLIKLYEQRTNRDHGQLLVLCLLLMVAAAINSSSLAFGVVAIVFVIIALYFCLLFHLKSEADRARAAFAMPQDKLNPATLRQDQRFLTRSMRRLTGLVATAGVSAAVLIFLFFPRGSGQGLLGQLQFRAATSLSGFNEQVSFGQISAIGENDQIVARVQVWKNDESVLGEPLLLRGLTADTYRIDPRSRTRAPQWIRSRPAFEDVNYGIGQPGDLRPLGDVWHQHVSLQPTGSRFLFALPGLMFYTNQQDRTLALTANRQVRISYSAADESIRSDAVMLPLEYDVYSTNTPRRPDTPDLFARQIVMPPPDSDPAVLAQIRQFTLQSGVTGELARQRPRWVPVLESNEDIARKIEHFLQVNYAYTLDLTDSKDLFKGTDPIVAFLTRVRKGHCEYFASAMTLMCQSIGIPARMVIGFKCDDFNATGSYYMVRQSQAHTWVEVLTPRGWITFDPTSGNEATVSRTAGIWQSVKHFFDFLQVKWAENVVAYDSGSRENVLQSFNGVMARFSGLASGALAWLRQQTDINRPAFWTNSLNLLSLLMFIMLATIVIAIAAYLVQQSRLRRRAARIGLDNLPVNEQVRLARQLAFYDQLAKILHRHHIARPHHLTPREFAESLVFLPGQPYDIIRRLTDLFYRIRFGQQELNGARQRRLETVVGRLGESLEHHAPPPRAG